MKVKHFNGNLIIVSLSKKNLLTLLSKLGREDSSRTLVKDMKDGVRLFVVAEPDEEHYGTTTPGKMHPKDEQFVKENQ